MRQLSRRTAGEFGRLLYRLTDRTRTRIVRADQGVACDAWTVASSSGRSSLVAGASALGSCNAPSTSRTSTPRVRRIGYLAASYRSDGVLDRISQAAYRTFQDGLDELGYVDGGNIELVLRYADEAKPAEIELLAVELTKMEPDILIASGTEPLVAMARATGNVPIVFIYVGAPVQTGLVQSLARPGSNVTGLTSFSPELGAKRIQLLKEAVPRMVRPGLLWNSSAVDDAQELAATQAAATQLGISLRSIEVRSWEELVPSLGKASSEGVDGLVVIDAGVGHTSVATMAQRSRLPAIGRRWEFAANGGLLTYGPNYHGMHRRAATYVDRILKGARAAEIPIEQPTTFNLVVNLKTAQALGLTIPAPLLAQATEVIQ